MDRTTLKTLIIIMASTSVAFFSGCRKAGNQMQEVSVSGPDTPASPSTNPNPPLSVSPLGPNAQLGQPDGTGGSPVVLTSPSFQLSRVSVGSSLQKPTASSANYKVSGSDEGL